MDKTAIVTGGTGGLGAPVVVRLLGDGWRVVVPWIMESELERLEPHDGLELVQADLRRCGLRDLVQALVPGQVTIT